MTSRAVVGVAFVMVFGLVFAGFGGWMLHTHEQDLENAEPVEAEIDETEVLVEQPDDDRGGRRTTRRGGGDDTPDYYAGVSYEYTFQGETYTSDSVFPGPNTSVSENRARQIVDRYEEGETVTAHVNAEDPDRAFLIETEPSPVYYVLIGVGVVICLAGLGKGYRAI